MMLIKNAKFRDIYLKYLVILSQEDAEMQERMFNIESIMDSVKDDDDLSDKLKHSAVDKNVNAILTVPYIDHSAGISFLVLATGYCEDNDLHIYKRKDFSTFQTVRKDKFDDVDFVLLEDLNSLTADCEFDYYSDYAKEILPRYTSDDLGAIRYLELLDDARNKDYPDDVLVYFFKKDFQPEGMWVRCEKIHEDCIEGILLNSPNQDFGLEYGDTVKFNVQYDENDEEYFCFVIVE